MTNINAKVLNEVTKTLIDSQKGYQKVCDLTDQSYALRAKFEALAVERQDLISAFQQWVREYGEEPATSGGVGGSLHRAWTDFISMFESDEQAALDALDEGEDHLADKIDSKLKEDGLDASTRDLLQRARASARYGEKFADQLTDH